MRVGFNDLPPFSVGLTHIDRMYGDLCRISPGQAGSMFDWVVARLAQRGIATLMVLGMGTRTLEQWRATIGGLAARYKDHPSVIAFELGNEPNNRRFCPPDGMPPAKAAEYTREGARAAIDAGWRKTLITAGPGRFGGRSEWQDYLHAMFDAGIPNDLHLACHPYPESTKKNYLRSIEYQIEFFRNVLQNRSDHGKVWVTETGYGTGSRQLDEDQQAHRLPKIVELCERKRVIGCALFRFADGGEGEGGDPYRWFGVAHADYSPKKSYATVKAAMAS